MGLSRVFLQFGSEQQGMAVNENNFKFWLCASMYKGDSWLWLASKETI